MSSLRSLDIFELRPIIQNFQCKLSTVTEYDVHKQILCLVSEDDDILLRYTHEKGPSVLKLISWFRINCRVIHDVSFDPAGMWLLVLCYDNTLHIVPALAIVDRAWLSGHAGQAEEPPLPYSVNTITSYIIPFVGPHECPNSKKCPNYMKRKRSTHLTNPKTASNVKCEENGASMEDGSVVNNKSMSGEQNNGEIQAENDFDLIDVEGNDLNQCKLNRPLEVEERQPASSRVDRTFMVSHTCPYPLSVVWWRTWEGVNRAAIGYSDGSICFVGLSPNCPFVASTNISEGYVSKLVICRDKIYENAILLVSYEQNNPLLPLSVKQNRIEIIFSLLLIVSDNFLQ